MTEEAAKAAEAARQEKEKARLDAIAGLSVEQISKAEELANWDFIKDSKEEPDYRDHLARFPQGVTLRMARTRLETILWAKLGFTPTADALEGFLALVSRRSPRGGSREVAREAEGRDREAAHARAQKGRAHANTDGRAGTAAGVDAEGLDHDRRARGRVRGVLRTPLIRSERHSSRPDRRDRRVACRRGPRLALVRPHPNINGGRRSPAARRTRHDCRRADR